MKHRRIAYRLESRQGQSAVIIALVLGSLLAALGLLFDGGRLYFERRAMQAAADAAAVGAAYEIKRSNNGQVETAGRGDATLNGYDSSASDVDVAVDHPPATGGRTGDARYAEVVITRQIPTTFLRLVGRNSSGVQARAVAGLEPDWGPPCVLALNEQTSGALIASGGANLNSPDCTVMVNSNSPTAIVANGGGCITGRQIGFVQPGSFATNGGNCVNPAPQGRAIPEPDPFDYLQDPDPADYPLRSNNRLNINNGNAASLSPLQPGYYKGGIRITGGDVVFEPGLYLIEGMHAGGSSSITGADVTFFNNGKGLKGIDIAGSVAVNLSAPTVGDWQNILFFNSRSIPKNNQTEVKIVGTSDSRFEGVHYFPSVHVDYAGNAAGGPVWSMLIADTIRFTGTSQLEIAFDPNSGRTPTTTKVTLVE